MMKEYSKKLGFTLLEMLIVISICTIIGLAVATFGRNIFVQNYATSKALVSEGDAKMALSRMITEIRRVQPAANGAYPLESVSSSAITFYCDLDNNGLQEKVRYWLVGEVLKRGVTKPTGQPYVYNTSGESITTAISEVKNASSTIFSYYDESYNGTASSSPLSFPVDIQKVRLIKVDLGNLTSQVMLRNLKGNL